MEGGRREGGVFEGGVVEVEEARQGEAGRWSSERVSGRRDGREARGGKCSTHDFVQKHQIESENSDANLHVCSLDVLLRSVA